MNNYFRLRGNISMSSIGITVYSVRLQDKELNQSYLLNDIQGRTFLDLINSFSDKHISDYENNEDLEKIFKTEEIEKGVYEVEGVELFRYFLGKIKTGAYGYASEIINSNTGELNYSKDIFDAEVMPFYYMVGIPNGEVENGILILQNHGIYGVKTIFQRYLNDFIKDTNNGYNLIIGNIAPRTYVTRFLNEGILQRIRFLRYDIPQDRSEQLCINNGVDSDGYEEYIIHKPIGFLGRKRMELDQFLRGQRLVNNIIEIEDFEYDNIKLDFKLGRRNKTINLKNIDNIIINEDITDLVDLLEGHPTKESIKPILLDTIFDYLKEMGLI